MVEGIDLAATRLIDDFTVEVRLARPSGALLAQLCFLYVVSERTLSEMTPEAHAANPVGTGPFIFRNWFRGDRLEFDTNKDYWGQVAPFDNLIMRVISESSSRAIEVETGGVDIALDIIASDVEILGRVREVNILRGPSYSNVFVGFNCMAYPFENNILLRQAISYAIDKDAVVQAVWSGLGSAAASPISPAIWGYYPNVQRYNRNLDRARTLLAQAGYPQGLEITLTTSDTQERLQIAEILQHQVGQIGVTMRVETLENATYLQRIINRTTQMFILGWTTITGDADYGLFETFTTGRPSWANTAGYSNQRVDDLLTIGRISSDPTVRLEAYAEAQRIIVSEAPWIFLYNREEVAAVRSDITNLAVPPGGRYNFNTIRFAN
jgi:peptide/nickel transport system substrate-binding protein